MFSNYVLFCLFLIGFQIQYTKCLKVDIIFFRSDYNETYRLIYLLEATQHPPFHSFQTLKVDVQNIVCNKTDKFEFSIESEKYECPMHDGSVNANHQLNDTHMLECPTFCEVCKKVYMCSRRSLSGIIYTPDGRKKDFISFQYGTLDKRIERGINWFIVTCYITLFTIFTNIVAYVFTD